jgi:hypothetical protein
MKPSSETGDHHEGDAAHTPTHVAATGFEMPSRDAEARDCDHWRNDIAAPVHDIENRAFDSGRLLALYRLTKCGLCTEVLRFGGKWCSKVSDENQA